MTKKGESAAGFDLHGLEIFHQVMRTGSFSAAARALGLSQPTVSQQVASLEERVGARLLDRSGRAVRPTPAGEVLDGFARRLLDLRDEALAAVSGSAQDVRGTLTVAASTIPGTYLLPQAIGAFRGRHPGVSVELAVGDSREVERRVAEGLAVLGAAGMEPVDRRLQGRPFWKDRLVLILPPGDPWASRRRPVTPKELTTREFVMREAGSGTLKTLQAALEARGHALGDLKVACRIGSTAAVLQAVRAGAGLSWVSKKAAEPDLAAGTLTTVKVKGLDIQRNCWLVTRKGRTLPPAGKAFLDVLLETGKKDRT